jgi:hypothetical protein
MHSVFILIVVLTDVLMDATREIRSLLQNLILLPVVIYDINILDFVDSHALHNSFHFVISTYIFKSVVLWRKEFC